MNYYDETETEQQAIAESAGNTTNEPTLDLNLEDSGETLIAKLELMISHSRAQWERADVDSFNLTSQRALNNRYYRGEQSGAMTGLYNSDYVDNELFIGVQSIIAYVTSSTPSCEIAPMDSETPSEVMAEQLELAISSHSEKWRLRKLLKVVVRNMYINKVGVLKLSYDPSLNDIKPTAVDPNRLILDYNCRQLDNPRFVCEVCDCRRSELIRRFPKKRAEIEQRIGSGGIVHYKEVWYTDDNGDECVAWYYGGLLLDAIRNPNFLYDGEGLNVVNVADRPPKPYVFFNYINDGNHLIDYTTPLEQAIPLQDDLNRRGRQITDNTDTANSILAVNARAVTDEMDKRMQKRAPNTVIRLNHLDDGVPIGNLITEIPPHTLPNYVVNDRQELRRAIHDVLGTPSQFRGSDSDKANTLGEAQMLKSQASGRQDEVVQAVEDGMSDYFKLLVQMMKVYFNDDTKYVAKDNDGKFVRIELNRTTIPDVASIAVESGSTLKHDKRRREEVAVSMAKMGLIDPYNFYRDLDLKDADKRYETLVKFKADPMSLVDDVKSEVADRDAYVDFAVLIGGGDAKPRPDIQPSYILGMRKLLMSDQFLLASKERQAKVLDYVRGCVLDISNRAKLETDDKQGLLVDPNVPVTPEPPEPEPEQPSQQPSVQDGVQPGMLDRLGQALSNQQQVNRVSGLPMPQNVDMEGVGPGNEQTERYI